MLQPMNRPHDNARYQLDRATVAEGFWPKLRRLAAHIPFAEDLVAAYYAALDPATPFRVRAVLLGAVAYFVVPVDLIPDVVVGLGYTDDAAVLATALKTLAGHIRPAHRDRARAALAEVERGAH
jgi:uncharacterized membrane protein YkvA (DUF1232 family)